MPFSIIAKVFNFLFYINNSGVLLDSGEYTFVSQEYKHNMKFNKKDSRLLRLSVKLGMLTKRSRYLLAGP